MLSLSLSLLFLLLYFRSALALTLSSAFPTLPATNKFDYGAVCEFVPLPPSPTSSPATYLSQRARAQAAAAAGTGASDTGSYYSLLFLVAALLRARALVRRIPTRSPSRNLSCRQHMYIGILPRNPFTCSSIFEFKGSSPM